MSIETIKLWFARAVPVPTDNNKNVQIGVHIEEFSEMLDSIKGVDSESDRQIGVLQGLAKSVATKLKRGEIQVTLSDRKAFLDAVADQIVTATGCGHVYGMNVVEALRRVDRSNWSKFDKHGQPYFDANGKIAKGPGYQRPDLEGLYE